MGEYGVTYFFLCTGTFLTLIAAVRYTLSVQSCYIWIEFDGIGRCIDVDTGDLEVSKRERERERETERERERELDRERERERERIRHI